MSWYWKNDSGAFVEFDRTTNSQIEEAFRAQPTGIVAVSIGKTKYMVNLQKLSQTNMSTGHNRPIQRIGDISSAQKPTKRGPSKRQRDDDDAKDAAAAPATTSTAPARVLRSTTASKTHTLVFPSISTAIFMFDLDKAAVVACDAIEEFLSKNSGPKYSFLRLVLIDFVPDATTIKEAETLVAFKKRWDAINKRGETRFEVRLGNIVDASSRGPADAIANASNATFAGGPATGGVNRAIHAAAGKELQKDSRAMYPRGAVVGKAYPVSIRVESPLYSQGIRHVIHVLGPNMNPTRANCLHGDYKLGCKYLKECYTNMLESFLSLYCEA